MFKFTFLLLIEVKFSTPLELQHIFEFWIAQCKYPNHFGKKIFPQIQREICSMKLRKCEHNSFQFFNNKRVKERSNSITQVFWCTDTGSLIFFIRSIGPLKYWIKCDMDYFVYKLSAWSCCTTQNDTSTNQNILVPSNKSWYFSVYHHCFGV